MSAAEHPTHRCPKCGFEMSCGPLKVTPGIEATLLWFCPVDHYELVRIDPLGELEAEAGAGSKTFEEFCEGENVIGVIHAKTGARGKVITEEGVDVLTDEDARDRDY